MPRSDPLFRKLLRFNNPRHQRVIVMDRRCYAASKRVVMPCVVSTDIRRPGRELSSVNARTGERHAAVKSAGQAQGIVEVHGTIGSHSQTSPSTSPSADHRRR